MWAINNHLRDFHSVHSMFDAWLVMALEDIQYVYDWRLDAEHKMARLGKPGMSDEQVKDFVDRFMPAYMHYCPALHSVGRGPRPRKVESKDEGGEEGQKGNVSDRAGAGAGAGAGEGETPALLIRLNKQRLPTGSTFV